MEASTPKPKTRDPICPFAGIAQMSDGSAVHVTAQVAGEERRYIIPAYSFNRFVFGQSAKAVNRDLLNDGQFEEAESVQLLWECGIPYLQDLYNDPIGEYRISFTAETLADLFSLNRFYIFLGGREHIRLSWRLGHEIQCQMRKEVEYGTEAPARMPHHMTGGVLA